MTQMGLQCEIQFSLNMISSISAPNNMSDFVYLSIDMFEQNYKSTLMREVYPLIFNNSYTFTKNFYSAESKYDLYEYFKCCQVVIELRKIHPDLPNGLLLAYCDTNAYNLLCPFELNDKKEIVLSKTIDFEGLSPRFHFSYSLFTNRCKLKSMTSEMDEGIYSKSSSLNNKDIQSKPPRHPRRRSKHSRRAKSGQSQYNAGAGARSLSADRSGRKKFEVFSPGYRRETVSSALRSQSNSPTRMSSAGKLEKSDSNDFVVRKVKDSLISRKPAFFDEYPNQSDAQEKYSNGSLKYRSSSANNLNYTKQEETEPLGKSDSDYSDNDDTNKIATNTELNRSSSSIDRNADLIRHRVNMALEKNLRLPYPYWDHYRYRYLPGLYRHHLLHHSRYLDDPCYDDWLRKYYSHYYPYHHLRHHHHHHHSHRDPLTSSTYVPSKYRTNWCSTCLDFY